MKKLILGIFALATISMVANAASIAWTTSNAKFDGSAISSNLSSYLIYLGSSSTIGAVDIDDTMTASDIISAIGTDTGSTGTLTTTGLAKGKVAGNLNPVPSDVSNGDYFAVLFAYVNDGKTYYNLSTASAASYNETAGVWTSMSINGWNFATKGESEQLTSNGGWTLAKQQDPITPEVPEPATGALVLAGVALLFKRRRA